jgi:5-methylcytosine-specific restriction protein A
MTATSAEPRVIKAQLPGQEQAASAAVVTRRLMPTLFKTGAQYTRRDVFRALGVPEDTWGGNWFTGYNEHDGALYIFANVGAPGRTGHDYANAWEQSKLRWFAKNGTRLRQPQVQKIIDAATHVHIFWRTANDGPFCYAGRATAVEVKDASPVEVLWSFD